MRMTRHRRSSSSATGQITRPPLRMKSVVCSPRYEIRPLKDFFSQMTSSNLPGLAAFINVMIAIAVSIGFLVTFLSMYTTIMERTREIGVLKSLGASKSYIAETILSETTLMCLAGVVGGIATELPGAVRHSASFPFTYHSDHAEMGFTRGHDCSCRGSARRFLSRMARQPQGSRRSSRVRIGRILVFWPFKIAGRFYFLTLADSALDKGGGLS